MSIVSILSFSIQLYPDVIGQNCVTQALTLINSLYTDQRNKNIMSQSQGNKNKQKYIDVLLPDISPEPECF